MKKIIAILSLLGLMDVLAMGQDTTVLLTKNFRFADGVYFSLAQLRANRPAYPLDDLLVQHFTNPQTSLTQLDAIVFKRRQQPFPLDSVWAICLDGVPAVRVPKDEINKGFPNFAALKLRGKICYFTYPDYRTKRVRVAAYNPVTGRPFRQGTVNREEEVIVEKILDFQSGQIADLNEENLLAWIRDDELLVETILELPKAERQEKLFKSLLIYVDRNPVYLMMNDE